MSTEPPVDTSPTTMIVRVATRAGAVPKRLTKTAPPPPPRVRKSGSPLGRSHNAPDPSAPTKAMRNMLVDPGVPKGTPPTTTTR